MPLREAIARAAVPLAGLAAMAAFAAHEVDATAAAESGYLAGVAAIVLAAVAFLAPAPAAELGLGAVLATAALWMLPAGPARGSAVLLLLVASLAVAGGRRLARRADLPRELPPGVTIPLALGLQALLRGDLLLAPRAEPRTFVLLLLLPVAGALATSSLARRHGGRAALAAGLALAVTPGWTIATTLALVALAAGDALAASAASAASSGAGGRSWRASWPARLGAVAAILLPIAWAPRAGLTAAAAGLALAVPGLGLNGAALLAIASLFLQPPAALPILSWIAIALLLAPAVLRPQTGRWRWAFTGGLLALAARSFAPAGGPGALAGLAAPLALIALSLDEERPAAAFQRAWTAALLGGTALFAAYPWLRERPLADLLALLGPTPLVAVAVAALASGLDWLGVGRAGSPEERASRVRALAPAVIALAALFLGLAVHVARPAMPLLAAGGAVRLSAGSRAWETKLAASGAEPAARAVAIESTLENGAGLAAGTPVAMIRIADGTGAAARFVLAAGTGTAEWAARRPDVARALAARGERAPAAWVSWVAGGFFGQRYRRVFLLPAGWRPAGLRIELAPGLPPDLALALYQVEILR